MLRRNRFGKIPRSYISIVRNGISRIKENVMTTRNLWEYWALQKSVVIIYVAWRLSTRGDHCETSRQYRGNL